MRRGLEIRVSFTPMRSSAEHLRTVYEMVTPVIDRAVVRESADVIDESDRTDRRQRQRGTR